MPATAAHMVALIGMLALRVDLELVAKAVLKRQRKINKMNHNPQKCPVCGSTPALAKVGGGYTRTVFVEDALRPFSFEVEEVVTAKLDAIAHDPKFQAQE